MGENTLSRIKQYIDYKGITVSSLEREAGMSNGSFASQLKNNKTIGVDKLENILRVFPEINPTWLLTGEGAMIVEREENFTRESDEDFADHSKERLYERLIEEKDERIRDLQRIIDDLRNQLELQEKGK